MSVCARHRPSPFGSQPSGLGAHCPKKCSAKSTNCQRGLNAGSQLRVVARREPFKTEQGRHLAAPRAFTVLARPGCRVPATADPPRARGTRPWSGSLLVPRARARTRQRASVVAPTRRRLDHSLTDALLKSLDSEVGEPTPVCVTAQMRKTFRGQRQCLDLSGEFGDIAGRHQ